MHTMISAHLQATIEVADNILWLLTDATVKFADFTCHHCNGEWFDDRRVRCNQKVCSDNNEEQAIDINCNGGKRTSLSPDDPSQDLDGNSIVLAEPEKLAPSAHLPNIDEFIAELAGDFNNSLHSPGSYENIRRTSMSSTSVSDLSDDDWSERDVANESRNPPETASRIHQRTTAIFRRKAKTHLDHSPTLLGPFDESNH